MLCWNVQVRLLLIYHIGEIKPGSSEEVKYSGVRLSCHVLMTWCPGGSSTGWNASVDVAKVNTARRQAPKPRGTKSFDGPSQTSGPGNWASAARPRKRRRSRDLVQRARYLYPGARTVDEIRTTTPMTLPPPALRLTSAASTPATEPYVGPSPAASHPAWSVQSGSALAQLARRNSGLLDNERALASRSVAPRLVLACSAREAGVQEVGTVSTGSKGPQVQIIFSISLIYMWYKLKKVNETSQLNFDYTIRFLIINTSKQDPTWIYLDKVSLTNIYLMKIDHFLLLSRDDVLSSEHRIYITWTSPTMLYNIACILREHH
jgi:hypothetical protein